MRIIAIFKRIMTELRRDKRTLAIVFVAPLLILTLLFAILQNSSSVTARLGVYQVDQTIVNQLKKNDNLHLVSLKERKSAKESLMQYNLSAVITQKENQLTVTYQNADTSLTGIVKADLTKTVSGEQMSKLKSALAKVTKRTKPGRAISEINSGMTINENYIYGKSNSSLFISIAPVMVGFFVFFFVFLISGISLLHERTTGTLNRLLISPVKRYEIVSAYTLAYGTLAVLQTVIIVSYVFFVLGVQNQGSFVLVLIINIILALVALSLGLLVSTFAASEFQMIQFIPLLVVPQIFFSGIFNISGMNQIWQGVAKIMPLYYGGDALTNVIKKGASISGVWLDLVVLIGFAIILLVLNIVGLKRYRRV
ncbi:MAG: ABC transporter permease [Leuconostoc pseudomesenteroides]